jgi:DNA-binding CsgD family transcriptional regulator
MPSDEEQIETQTGRATAGGLVQRTDELAHIDQVVRRATHGAGQIVYIEGGPGVGRTSLLAAAAEIGARAGAGVLRATARSPERGFRFGVALQLFEAGWLALAPDEQEALLRGPTGPAARLISGEDAGAEEFALVHALLWLTRTQAGLGAGLVVAVDDIDRADGPSLRFLAYLAARIESLPVTLVITARTHPRAEDPAAVSALRDAALVLHLAALEPDSVAQIVTARRPDAGVALHLASARLTGGNPRLLDALLTALDPQQADPPAERLAELVPPGALGLASAALAALDPAARTLAQALALHDDTLELTAAAAVAGVPLDAAAAAADALIDAEILRPGEQLQFTSPMLRTAIRATVPDAQRRLARRRGTTDDGVAALVTADALERALAILDDRTQREVERTDPVVRLANGRHRAWALWHQGAIPEALAAARAALIPDDGNADRPADDVDGAAPAELAGVIAACHLELGDLDRARAMLELLRAPDSVPAAELPVLLDVRAQVRLAHGRAAAALLDALEAGRLAVARVGGDSFDVVNWRCTAAQARLALDEPGGARELAEEELERARSGEVTRTVLRCLRVLGLAADGRRRLDLLTEAVTLGAESPPRLEYLRALVDLGAATRRANRRSAARAPLVRALELCQAYGATALARRAEVEIAACGARQGRTRLAGAQALTPSERRVATLAARGDTTRQIAGELFVTPKTVEFHLRHVYRKLGIPSTRADLARTLAANDVRNAREN